MTTSHKTKWRESLIKLDAVASARIDGERAGYVKALDDVMNLFPNRNERDQEMRMTLLGMKVDYESNGRKYIAHDGENIAEYYDNLRAGNQKEVEDGANP